MVKATCLILLLSILQQWDSTGISGVTSPFTPKGAHWSSHNCISGWTFCLWCPNKEMWVPFHCNWASKMKIPNSQGREANFFSLHIVPEPWFLKEVYYCTSMTTWAMRCTIFTGYLGNRIAPSLDWCHIFKGMKGQIILPVTLVWYHPSQWGCSDNYTENVVKTHSYNAIL